MVKFLDLGKQYKTIKSEINEAIFDIVANASFVGGNAVKQFEQEFASFHEGKHAIGVGNGTDALEIAIEALGLPKGSEVIVPANSFIASSEAVTRSGHKVVFCDCNIENYTIAIDDLERKITKETRAIIVVHLYGHPCDMDAVIDLATKYTLRVIEDCAQAHASQYKGRKVGFIGDIGTFSFYPGKNLGAYGDGGAIVTNDDELAQKCRMIANHGRIGKYDHVFEGRNSRLDALQAAVLSVKLKRLSEWTESRRRVASIYYEVLDGLEGIVLPQSEDWAFHVYHLFVIRTSRRDELKEFLSDHKIETGVHYPISLPLLDAYEHLKNDDDFVANRLGKNLLSLPMGDHLSDTDAYVVAEKVKQFFFCKE